MLAFVKHRTLDNMLPYQMPIVQEGSGYVADELSEQKNFTNYTELTWVVLVLLSITMVGLDAGGRYG